MIDKLVKILNFKTICLKDLDDVVNVKDIQKMLHNVSRQYVCKLIRTGRIPGKKIGKGYLVPKIYVIKYILENEENA